MQGRFTPSGACVVACVGACIGACVGACVGQRVENMWTARAGLRPSMAQSLNDLIVPHVRVYEINQFETSNVSYDRF